MIPREIDDDGPTAPNAPPTPEFATPKQATPDLAPPWVAPLPATASPPAPTRPSPPQLTRGASASQIFIPQSTPPVAPPAAKAPPAVITLRDGCPEPHVLSVDDFSPEDVLDICGAGESSSPWSENHELRAYAFLGCHARDQRGRGGHVNGGGQA